MNSTIAEKQSSPSLLGGAMIIAGTAVGAGMFSLPVAFSGMWFLWSLLALFVTWFFMLHSGLMVLESNLHYPVGSSYNTMVKDSLGSVWNIINGLSLVFVLYILDYAYISGGGSIVKHTVAEATGVDLPQKLAGISFAFVTALIVWFSTKAVDRITTILLGAMVLCFVLSSGIMLDSFQPKLLLDFDGVKAGNSYWIFLFAALPYCLTSFGYHGNVPSLMKYYGKEPKKILKCLLYGTLLALSIYALWLTVSFGNISRDGFQDIIAAGGNVGVLVEALSGSVDTGSLSVLLTIFANFAMATSFLGVSLGLFDFIADKFSLPDTALGRFKTALITFVPSTVGATFFPDGFIYAIGYAGLVATIWGAIVPALMVKTCRKKFGSGMYRVWGGNGLVYAVVGFGLLYASCHILAMMDLLPVYK